MGRRDERRQARPLALSPPYFFFPSFFNFFFPCARNELTRRSKQLLRRLLPGVPRRGRLPPPSSRGQGGTHRSRGLPSGRVASAPPRCYPAGGTAPQPAANSLVLSEITSSSLSASLEVKNILPRLTQNSRKTRPGRESSAAGITGEELKQVLLGRYSGKSRHMAAAWPEQLGTLCCSRRVSRKPTFVASSQGFRCLEPECNKINIPLCFSRVC